MWLVVSRSVPGSGPFRSVNTIPKLDIYTTYKQMLYPHQTIHSLMHFASQLETIMLFL